MNQQWSNNDQIMAKQWSNNGQTMVKQVKTVQLVKKNAAHGGVTAELGPTLVKCI